MPTRNFILRALANQGNFRARAESELETLSLYASQQRKFPRGRGIQTRNPRYPLFASQHKKFPRARGIQTRNIILRPSITEQLDLLDGYANGENYF